MPWQNIFETLPVQSKQHNGSESDDDEEKEDGSEDEQGESGPKDNLTNNLYPQSIVKYPPPY